jgi:hypothetical protein
MELGAVKPFRVKAPNIASDKPKEEKGWELSVII